MDVILEPFLFQYICMAAGCLRENALEDKRFVPSEIMKTKKQFSTGIGSYIYIDTSLPRKYNEKARLNSPWMRGAQRMTFYYCMYGSTVESLSIYVRINGSEERIWSRHGNLLSSTWTKGCVSINVLGTYQVEKNFLLKIKFELFSFP